MKTSDIIGQVALLLDDKALTEYLRGKTNLIDDGSEEYRKANTLVAITNFVISDTFSNFIKITRTQNVTPSNGKVYYSSLVGSALKILNVYDKEGRKVKYELADTYIESKDAKKVEYVYLPPNYSFNENYHFNESDMSKKGIIYGVLSEYCLSIFRFDEAVMWHEKYIDTVKAQKKISNKTIKNRSWL